MELFHRQAFLEYCETSRGPVDSSIRRHHHGHQPLLTSDLRLSDGAQLRHPPRLLHHHQGDALFDIDVLQFTLAGGDKRQKLEFLIIFYYVCIVCGIIKSKDNLVNSR